MNPFIYFVAFFIFLICQYAIWVCSNLVANYFSLTGRAYWCAVLVAFLLLNEFCFGAYDFSVRLLEDDEKDDWIDKWNGDE